MRRPILLGTLVLLVLLIATVRDGRSQAGAADMPTCVPIAKRTGEVGCWIIVDEPVGSLRDAPVYWHLDTFPTRAAAEAAKQPGAAVIEALGKTWLMTIGGAGYKVGSGEHVAAIGPLPTSATTDYSAAYMEAIFTPGMESSTHTHSGPEAWYTVSGETCLETPDGVMLGRAGGPPVIVPAGPPMHLTATGTSVRRAIVLILHDRSQPATSVTHAWTPKGLCKSR
jgi:quercetin dioxygenase-like cupin family protein